MKAVYVLIIFLLFLTGLSHPLAGQTFVLNGSATALGGDCYQLTPDNGGLAGSIFSQNLIDLTQPFNLSATLFFGCKDGNGADGIVFIFATSNTSLGIGGGGIGYQGITPSLAVEFDDYFNSNFNDPTADHVAVTSMGNMDHNQPTNLSGPINLANIENCEDHCFTINWNPSTFTLTCALDNDIIVYSGDIAANIFGGVSQVYYGFSAGTGSLSNIHRVCFGPPLLQAMMDVTICEGESIELQADPNGIAWDWDPDPTLSAFNISNPVATPDATTTYTTTIEYPCGYFHNDTVQVTLIPEPVVYATNNGPVCEGESLSLMAGGGSTYEWSGPMGYSSSQQNPVINNVQAGMAGFYYVTVTDASGCTSETFTEVEIDLGPEIEIDPPPLLCENHAPIQLSATPSGGLWSGDISPDGIFDPSYVGAGVHALTYTATNMNGCANEETILVEVFSIPDVVINPVGPLCADGDPVQLTGSPTGGIWSGEISINGIFDPGEAGEGYHLITYTANDGNGCTNSEDFLIEVSENIPVEIFPIGPFCSADTSVILTATPSGGEWGGIADSMGTIHPADLGAGIYPVFYNNPDQSGCYSAQLDIEIIDAPLVNIEPIGPLCLDVTQQSLNATPPGGIWTGAADPSGIVVPINLGPGNHPVIYTFSNQAGCSGADTINIQILPDGPQISNLNIACDSFAASYVVSFIITGGDPSSYSVEGPVTGTLIPGNPAIFVSQPVASDSSYHFTVTDSNQCDSAVVAGSFICNCATNAGVMDLTAINACAGDTITVVPPAGVVLDPDDTLMYVLHLGFPDSIISFSYSNEFIFQPPLQTGQTYFISTIAGNISGGNIDLSDPCLSSSFGTPVSWQQEPSGYIEGPVRICKGESTSISFLLSGAGPFSVKYSDGTDTFLLDTIFSGYSVSVFPSITTTYTLLDITSVNPPGCSSLPDASWTIEVRDIPPSDQSVSICRGDSIWLDNSFQTLSGIYTDTLTSADGCDSIIQTSLTVNDPDTTFLNMTSCDSSKAGIFVEIAADQNGCDSMIVTTVAYAENDTTLIQSTTCDLASSGVFYDWYISQEGCDSLVIETIEYIPSDTTSLSSETCDESAAGIFTLTLSNSLGCDSLIINTVSFVPPDTTFLYGETCKSSDSGTFIYNLVNVNGCDSLVVETISLLPSDTLLYFFTTCSAQDTGTVIDSYTNSSGCDSTVIITNTLAPDDSCHVLSKDVYIPNTFSPNGDGNNDRFLVFTNPEIESAIAYLRIFDRWGDMVLDLYDVKSNDPQYGWDGNVRGKQAAPGVYVYVVHIVYADSGAETIVGEVTLLR